MDPYTEVSVINTRDGRSVLAESGLWDTEDEGFTALASHIERIIARNRTRAYNKGRGMQIMDDYRKRMETDKPQ